MRTVRIALVTALVTLVVIYLFMYLGGRAYLERRSGWGEWANFTVPGDVLPLKADVKVNMPKIIVCNTGNGPWHHALVRITDDYMAEIDKLAEGKCKAFDVTDFRTNSWKRMPPPKTLVIKDVEVLTSVTEKAYFKRSVPRTE